MNIHQLAVFASLVVTLMVVSIAAMVGYDLGAASVSRDLIACRTEQANDHKAQAAERQQQAEAAEVAAHSLQLAFAERQRVTDDLTRQLSAQRAAAAKLKKERQDALQNTTDGNVCLNADALRLLDGAPGLRAALPGSPGGTAGAHADRVATDTDVARWALDAGERYRNCVMRFDALIDATGGPPRE